MGVKLSLSSASVEPTGYAHGLYAASFAEHGSRRVLPRSGAWILERSIPGFPYRDAMGCYPLVSCRDWTELPADMEELREDIVALSMVTDPFGNYDRALLRECFTDVSFPFKEHFVTDLERAPETYISRHHRRYATASLRQVRIEQCPQPVRLLPVWTQLYSVLVRRHGVTGIAAFSEAAFARQLVVPGIVAFRAIRSRKTVGIVLWYVQGDAAYYHLAAYSQAGYDARASFALFRHCIDFFAASGLRWLNLGAGAGLHPHNDGLARFKEGWATGTRTAYFCGRVFDREKYREIVQSSGHVSSSFFPAYREGEFGNISPASRIAVA